MAVFCCLLFLSANTIFGQSGPPMPPDFWLDSYSFLKTNWASDLGYLPISYTNLVSVSDWGGNALLLDRTNLVPAYLRYRIEETNGYLNFDLGAGALYALVVPDWASSNTTQHGHGPGSDAYILAAGDWSTGSPNGFWGIYINSGGTNIYFTGVSNSVVTNYVSAPISWGSNSIHLISLLYSTNTLLFLDGKLAATGGPVKFVPNTNTWTNGFYVGSDDLGYEQFRGTFLYVELDTTNVEPYLGGTNYYNDDWSYMTNGYYTWLDGGGGSGDDLLSGGSLNHNGSSGECIFSNAVYLTNMTSTNIPGQGATFTFTIEGGSSGAAYDVFSVVSLVGPTPGNAVWTWLGQGTNCGIYSVTNQPEAQTYYILGTPLLASDGSGLTVAWERLVGKSSDGYGTPNAWYLAQGLDPQTPGIGSEDLNGSGLPNWEKYLYGANPEATATFAIWVSQPSGTSGIP
jgi:hypothetical protein